MSGPRVALFATIVVAAYWIPASLFPDQVIMAISALLFVSSFLTAWRLLPDMRDLWIYRGEDMSWQAVVAKVGLFLLTFAFCLQRMWVFVSTRENFPWWMVHSPLGNFFTYAMGIGLAMVFVGFNYVDEILPTITRRSLIFGAVVIGVIIGFVVAKIPI